MTCVCLQGDALSASSSPALTAGQDRRTSFELAAGPTASVACLAELTSKAISGRAARVEAVSAAATSMAYQTQWQTQAEHHPARSSLAGSQRSWTIQTPAQDRIRLVLASTERHRMAAAQTACTALVEAVQRTVRSPAGSAVTIACASSAQGSAAGAAAAGQADMVAAALSGAACTIAMEEAGLSLRVSEHSSLDAGPVAAAVEQLAGDCHGSRIAAGQVAAPRSAYAFCL